MIKYCDVKGSQVIRKMVIATHALSGLILLMVLSYSLMSHSMALFYAVFAQRFQTSQ
jgi:hypothetical protein